MARVKYELVASVYDKYNTGSKYTDEIVVKLEDRVLDSLESIDRFTCLHTKDSLLATLPEDYADKNTLSIRVSRKDSSYYMPVVYDQPELVEVLDSLYKKDVITRDGYDTYKIIKARNSLTESVIDPIQRAIMTKDRNLLEDNVDENSNFFHHVQRYINSDDADVYELENLKLEAKNYMTFRSNMVYQQKLATKRSQYRFRPILKSQPMILKPAPYPSSKIVFGEKYGIEKTQEYNQILPDKEEFLDENEVAAITGYNDEFTGSTISKKEGNHARR